jgi:hypothetical protein
MSSPCKASSLILTLKTYVSDSSVACCVVMLVGRCDRLTRLVRVLRVGGDLTLLSATLKQILGAAFGCGWCCRRKKLWSEDDFLDLPHRQPL